ncbi:Retrovirus-related Pol polyprotein from type-1 retrotransposable element [Trichinella nativa]|uniref:Retrovirus-related Pol polyprotein from type-1 retrotransposable element n=2 Tax=Trichinella nativa TaxID=6335 RepID=A0A0V1KNI6_9BILA|nr:Retrovirus-related Pol polyprotein from type-1 retrotransposable element [Trichinella nativa]
MTSRCDSNPAQYERNRGIRHLSLATISCVQTRCEETIRLCYTAKPLSDHGSRQYGIVTKKQFFEHSGQDVEHFADDKNTGTGVVISRAVNTLRSDETHPCNRFARRVLKIALGNFVKFEKIFPSLKIALEGKIHIDVEEIRSMVKSVKSAPLKPEQKVALIRSHLLPRLQFLFSTAEVDSRKAWLIDSIIRGCVKEILHSVKAGMCTDIFYIPSRDGGMGLTSLGEFSLFSRQKALAKMAGSSDPLSKRVAEFFIERWNIARDPKVIEAARRVYQKKRYQRFFQTYQSGGWNEFSGNTIGNAWLTNGRARGRNFIMAVKFRSNTAATRAENLRGRLGMKECRFSPQRSRNIPGGSGAEGRLPGHDRA